jgi:hypothetical protein
LGFEEEAGGLFEVGAGVEVEVFEPGRAGGVLKPGEVGEGVAEHGRGHVFGFDEGGVGPGFVVAVPVAGDVGEEDAEAEEDDGEIGEEFVVEDGALDAGFAEEADVGEFVGESADEVHGFVELGAGDADDEFLFAAVIGAGGAGREVFAGVVDEPEVGGVVDELEIEGIRVDAHVGADAVEEGADGGFGGIEGVGEEFGDGEDWGAAGEGVGFAEFVVQPVEAVLDPGFGGGVAGAGVGEEPVEHAGSRYCGRGD